MHTSLWQIWCLLLIPPVFRNFISCVRLLCECTWMPGVWVHMNAWCVSAHDMPGVCFCSVPYFDCRWITNQLHPSRAVSTTGVRPRNNLCMSKKFGGHTQDLYTIALFCTWFCETCSFVMVFPPSPPPSPGVWAPTSGACVQANRGEANRNDRSGLQDDRSAHLHWSPEDHSSGPDLWGGAESFQCQVCYIILCHRGFLAFLKYSGVSL